jgi:ABC-type phosphate transport system substrate-binding protein
MTKKLALILAMAAALGCGEGSSGSGTGGSGKTSGGGGSDEIVCYGRENNSGTYMYFKEHVLANEDFAADVQTLPGTAAVINAVSKDKASIGYGGIGYVKGVRALKVKKDTTSPSVEPSLDNVVNGSYPISRSLYFYTVGQPEGAVKHFIDWARGPVGQKICEEVHYYPLPAAKKGGEPGAAPQGKATITIKGSDTMVILGQRWAEHYMKSNPDISIQITGGGSGVGIAALINGSTNICQASRPMKAEEKKKVQDKFGKAPMEFEVALDGLAVFVHEANTLTEISIPELKSIYTGKTKTWSALVKP